MNLSASRVLIILVVLGGTTALVYQLGFRASRHDFETEREADRLQHESAAHNQKIIDDLDRTRANLPKTGVEVCDTVMSLISKPPQCPTDEGTAAIKKVLDNAISTMSGAGGAIAACQSVLDQLAAARKSADCPEH